MRRFYTSSESVKKGLWFSPWLLAGIVGLLVCVAAVFLVRNTEDEKQRILTAMKDRADVLIWALEGSTRSLGHLGGHGGRGNPLPVLVEEVARQPYVSYIAILDAEGRALMHSNPELIGSLSHHLEAHRSETGGALSQGHLVTVDGKKVYEVCNAFTPTRFYKRGPGMEGHRGHWSGLQQGGNGSYVSVGIDASDFDEALHAYRRHTILMAGLTALAGLAGLAMIFFIQNYKRSKRMLDDSQALATHVVHTLPVGLVAINGDNEIVLSNQHARLMLHLPAEARSKEALHQVPALDWWTLMKELDAGTIILERETELFATEPNALPVSVSASRIINSEGISTGYLFIIRDLGEVRRLQKQVQLSERLSAIGNLAAGVAHEMRNPLSSIKGYATWLVENLQHNETALATGQLLIQETERLNRVVSDLLGVAKPGKVHARPARLSEVIDRAVRLVALDAEEKGITVETPPFSDNSPEPIVHVDTDRLVQALLNLLLNAVQALDQGGTIRITLEESIKPDTKDRVLAVKVSDTGPGMPPETLEKVFTPYFTTKASGTGLGLTITSQIIEQHGGTITVSSRQGKGSVFTITLPIADAEE